MATLFTKIIEGEIPGRFVWSDETCVAFLTIEPLTDGHTMVVPRDEIEQWTDADEQTWTHLQRVAGIIGRAQQAEWEAPRVGMLLEGFLVPHLHVVGQGQRAVAERPVDAARQPVGPLGAEHVLAHGDAGPLEVRRHLFGLHPVEPEPGAVLPADAEHHGLHLGQIPDHAMWCQVEAPGELATALHFVNR